MANTINESWCLVLANRRMFSKNVTENDYFKSMPLSAQALYFHLGMQADDDGILDNAISIKREIGANDDDFKVLLAKGYIISFNDGIYALSHWKINNYIQRDRYHKTIYQRDFNKLADTDVNEPYRLLTLEEQKEKCIHSVSKLDTQSSLVKSSLGQSSQGQSRSGKSSQGKVRVRVSQVNTWKTVEQYFCDKNNIQSADISTTSRQELERLADNFSVDQVKLIIDKMASYSPKKPIPYLIQALKETPTNHQNEPSGFNSISSMYLNNVCDQLTQYLTVATGMQYPPFSVDQKENIKKILKTGVGFDDLKSYVDLMLKNNKDISISNDLTYSAYLNNTNSGGKDDLPF